VLQLYLDSFVVVQCDLFASRLQVFLNAQSHNKSYETLRVLLGARAPLAPMNNSMLIQSAQCWFTLSQNRQFSSVKYLQLFPENSYCCSLQTAFRLAPAPPCTEFFNKVLCGCRISFTAQPKLGKLPTSQKIFSENAAQMNAVVVELEVLQSNDAKFLIVF